MTSGRRGDAAQGDQAGLCGADGASGCAHRIAFGLAVGPGAAGEYGLLLALLLPAHSETYRATANAIARTVLEARSLSDLVCISDVFISN